MRPVRAAVAKARSYARRARSRSRRLSFPWRVRHLSGPRQVAATPDEAVVVCLVRDGAAYLGEFLRHYRALGAKHLVFLDNGSTDGTPGLLAGEADVTVLATGAPYRDYKGIMKRYLIERFGRSNWVLCVDIDELFDYPRRAGLPLAGLLGYLNRHGYTAVVAHLLDLFPKGALRGDDGRRWRAEHRFYDNTGLWQQPYQERFGHSNRRSNEGIVIFHGGVRDARLGVSPLLTKHPLTFPPGKLRIDGSHNVFEARVADFSAVLLHYKYVAGFLDYMKRIVAEASFYENSSQYRGYVEAIEADPALSLHSATATELRSIDQLVAEGFLVTSPSFAARAVGEGG